jgi:hypothetical protein
LAWLAKTFDLSLFDMDLILLALAPFVAAGAVGGPVWKNKTFFFGDFV